MIPSRGPHELVELVRLDATLRLDVRYSRSDNFLGKPVYPVPRAFLQRVAAEALVRIHQGLAQEGLGLLIHDGYRPWSVTRTFWEETPPELRRFVADPAFGSRHNRGCAVDLSLFRRDSGQPLLMPSDFDEFTERAAIDYSDAPQEAIQNRTRLIQAMATEGFTPYRYEWWHYDHPAWENYPVLDLAFSEIEVR
jgi:D-alanyl-D-alanine dipeptidase